MRLAAAVDTPEPVRVRVDRSAEQEAVAILPWGILEDFLDPLGISLERFCSDFTGSYVFGYAVALRRAGVQPVLIYISCRVMTPLRCTHGATGATICILPAPKIYRALRRRVSSPRARSVQAMFGPLRGWRRAIRPALAVIRETILYLETPIVSLARAIRRERCSAVLCQEYEYPRFDVCVAMGRVLRLPVFATFQGGDYQRSRLEAFIRPTTMQACDGLIIASRAESLRVVSRYGVRPDRIAQIPNPVDSEIWTPADRRESRMGLRLPDAACVIVWHGRVDVWKKGLDVLLEAWSTLRSELPHEDIRLVLIGAGHDGDKLRQLIATSGRGDILWIEEFLQDRNRLRSYLGAGDVYVFPSRHEGFPVAPIEAMACGLPIVAADARGVAEILSDGENSGGVLVPVQDARALADGLARFVADRSWCREMGARARQTVLARFSPEAVGNALRTLLHARAIRAAGG